MTVLFSFAALVASYALPAYMARAEFKQSHIASAMFWAFILGLVSGCDVGFLWWGMAAR